MSKTFKTNIAREARVINNLEIEATNSKDFDTANKLYKDLIELEVNGVRYGNHRKMKAEEKVINRRKVRRSSKPSKEDFD